MLGAEGVRKPDRRLFEIAAARCGVSAVDGGWMVGDSLVKDIGGGRAAGLRTVWVNAGGVISGGMHADHVVRHVTEAMALLPGLSRPLDGSSRRWESVSWPMARGAAPAATSRRAAARAATAWRTAGRGAGRL